MTIPKKPDWFSENGISTELRRNFLVAILTLLIGAVIVLAGKLEKAKDDCARDTLELVQRLNNAQIALLKESQSLYGRMEILEQQLQEANAEIVRLKKRKR